jgi:hypothetical protein
MARKHLQSPARLVALVILALGASSTAFADDNSMSVLTGDSYAYFNRLDNHPGAFNSARTPSGDETGVLVRSPRPDQVEGRVLVAKPSKGRRTNPFRDDTAG